MFHVRAHIARDHGCFMRARILGVCGPVREGRGSVRKQFQLCENTPIKKCYQQDDVSRRLDGKIRDQRLIKDRQKFQGTCLLPDEICNSFIEITLDET